MTEITTETKIRYSEELRGYAWRVYQTAEGREAEQEEGATEFGFHGNDVSPIVEYTVETEERTEIHLDNAQRSAEYLADDDGTERKAFFVVTEDDEEPKVVDGWQVEGAEDIGEDWSYKDDSGYTVKVLHEFADNSLLFVTYVG